MPLAYVCDTCGKISTRPPPPEWAHIAVNVQSFAIEVTPMAPGGGQGQPVAPTVESSALYVCPDHDQSDIWQALHNGLAGLPPAAR